MELDLCERLVTMDRRRTARRVADIVEKINMLIFEVKDALEANHLTHLLNALDDLNDVCDELNFAGNGM